MFRLTSHMGLVLAIALVVPGAVRADGARPATAPAGSTEARPDYDGYQQLLDEEGRAAMARGDFEYARHLYQLLLEMNADDMHAHREIGRASHALGQFEMAVQHLRRADSLDGAANDPELHYVLGESLYALGRKTEARSIHALAANEIGEPEGRMETLWLARIHARQGHVDRADSLYESLLPYSGQPDPEVSLSRAEAHVFADDWAGAEEVLRDLLERMPEHDRAADMLAWVLEAQGKFDEEETLRAARADGVRRFRRLLDHGRALERTWDYDGALARYREAEEVDPDGTPGLQDSIDRMRYRLTTEVAAAAILRSDPTGDATEWRAGAAVPIGSRHGLSLRASYETAEGNAPVSDADSATLGAGVVVGRGYDVTAALEVNVNYHGVTRQRGEDVTRASGFELGTGAELRTAPDRPLQLQARADLNMPWREAANTIREGGRLDGLTAHVFTLPFGPDLVVDTGAQVRRLQIRALDGGADPGARQALIFGGVDYVAWRDSTSTARGEFLDENLLWPTYLADSLVLSYRHYEAFSDSDFDDRILLVDHARIDELSATMRKALPGGGIALELRGGGGYDFARELRLWRAGGSLLLSPWTFTRLSVTYDVATESTTGLVGRRHAGWMTLHVDL